MTATTNTSSTHTCKAKSRIPLSGNYPRIGAACVAVTAAKAQANAAKSDADRMRAGRAARAATDEANSAYGEELLPALFGGAWRLSSNFPFNTSPCPRALFDHALVFECVG